jgi:hypothetical protein
MPSHEGSSRLPGRVAVSRYLATRKPPDISRTDGYCSTRFEEVRILG